MANIWFPWVTRGLFLGLRRQFYQPQFDDVLIATEEYGTGKIVRTGAVDLQFHAQYQKVSCRGSVLIYLIHGPCGRIYVIQYRYFLFLRMFIYFCKRRRITKFIHFLCFFPQL